jgi:ribonuclease VapC
MFVDASVIVAIVKPESDGESLSARLDQVRNPVTSPLAIVEAVMSLGKQKKIPPAQAQFEVTEFLGRGRVSVRSIDEATGELAVHAHARYGKGSGHPARLNLGDCFAYAMAKQHAVPLLYKGDDFSQTDLA